MYMYLRQRQLHAFRVFELKRWHICAGFEACITGGVKLFDTAEIYGPGRSEELLGKFLRETGAKDVQATSTGDVFRRFQQEIRNKSTKNNVKF